MEREAYTELVTRCRSIIQVGSKSFAMASRILGPEQRDAAFFLYAWCRYCDDQIDEADGISETELEFRLTSLRQKTDNCFTDEKEENPVFAAFQYVVNKYKIPRAYAHGLLDGFEMDVRGRRYESLDDLLLYCHRVAGTVGLMMAHVMGVSRPEALAQANDLGIGMQLTNIARDVFDDARGGRVYLPLRWLKEGGIDPDKLTEPQYRAELVRCVDRLLCAADTFYASGDEGTRDLSLRSAFTILAARHIYASIGELVRHRKESAWDQRAVVSIFSKRMALLKSAWILLRQIPSRLFRPWKAVPLIGTWRFQP